MTEASIAHSAAMSAMALVRCHIYGDDEGVNESPGHGPRACSQRKKNRSP